MKTKKKRIKGFVFFFFALINDKIKEKFEINLIGTVKTSFLLTSGSCDRLTIVVVQGEII